MGDFWIMNDFWIKGDLWIMGDFSIRGGGQTHKQTNRHKHTSIPWLGLAYGLSLVKINQIQITKMQKYKWHICRNTNNSVVAVVLEVRV